VTASSEHANKLLGSLKGQELLSRWKDFSFIKTHAHLTYTKI